ncbi:MAG: EAL domain-containing protein [Burkholderiaceae bacterium]|jgi:diguanylate cyclase (GGDEF)-like protein/PAS domain S-box-containing protein
MNLRARILSSVDHNLVVAIGLAVCIFFGSLLGLAGFVDDIARQREEAQVRNAIQGQIQRLESAFPGQLDWDEAIINLDNHFSEAWAATNVGDYFCETLRFDFTYVLDADAGVLFGMEQGHRVSTGHFEPLRAASTPLIASVREQEARRGSFVPPFKASGGDISAPIQASGIARMDSLNYVLTATLVQPNVGAALPHGPRSVIVIAGKRIDSDFLRPITNELLISNLRLMPAGERAAATVGLEDEFGEEIGALGWTPKRPGAYLIAIAMLPIFLAVCLPLGLYLHGRRIARRLGVAMRELEDVSASVPGVIFSFRIRADGSACFPFASPAIVDVVGLTPEEVGMDSAPFMLRVHEDDRVWLRIEIERSARDLSPWRGEFRYQHPEKGERWIEASSRPRAKADGSIVWHGFAADVTERKRTEATLRNAAAVLANTGEGVIVTDLDGTITSVNPAFTAITGYSESDALGQNMRLMRSERYDRTFLESVWDVIRVTGSWQGEIWSRCKSGEVLPKWVTISTVHDKGGKAVGYVGTFTDISQLKATESRLEQLATHDPLTGLPNRLMLQTRLEHALARSHRQPVGGAVLFLDLDRFKTVNDSLGHSAGDQVLRTVSKRLKARLRETDTLTRLGGDEFVILLEDLPSPDYVGHVARALIEQVLKPVELDGGHEIFVSTSIGISLFPGDGQSPEELIRNADAALYLAKEDGRGRFRFFTEELTKFASARLELEARLRRALERHEFVLHYQPLMSLQSRRLKGIEALVRWRDPERGLVAPAHFIELAEETGLIASLGDWVLRTACSQMKAWLDQGLLPGRISVNLSPVQFRHGNIVAQVQKVLDDTGLPADALELEITEGALMHSASDTEAKLICLRDLGVRVSIDDFGTGYSSLAYLKRFPIDTLKIDQAFVRGISHDATDRQIVIALLTLAKSLRFDSVAEGIETEEQAEFLIDQGCDSGQGYLFGQPLSATEVGRLLASEAGVIVSVEL